MSAPRAGDLHVGHLAPAVPVRGRLVRAEDEDGKRQVEQHQARERPPRLPPRPLVDQVQNERHGHRLHARRQRERAPAQCRPRPSKPVKGEQHQEQHLHVDLGVLRMLLEQPRHHDERHEHGSRDERQAIRRARPEGEGVPAVHVESRAQLQAPPDGEHAAELPQEQRTEQGDPPREEREAGRDEEKERRPGVDPRQAAAIGVLALQHRLAHLDVAGEHDAIDARERAQHLAAGPQQHQAVDRDDRGTRQPRVARNDERRGHARTGSSTKCSRPCAARSAASTSAGVSPRAKMKPG